MTYVLITYSCIWVTSYMYIQYFYNQEVNVMRSKKAAATATEKTAAEKTKTATTKVTTAVTKQSGRRRHLLNKVIIISDLS